MPHAIPGRWYRPYGIAVLALAASVSAAHAQGTAEVYGASASLKTAGGASASAPVVISISRWTTDAERAKARESLKAGGNTALRANFASLPEAGFIQVGQVKTPLKFAHVLPVEGGKVVMVATDKPIHYVGAGSPGDTPKMKEGYDMAVAIFQVDSAGKGDAGDLAPAAKVRLGDQGGFEIEDYGAEAVRLVNIAKK